MQTTARNEAEYMASTKIKKKATEETQAGNISEKRGLVFQNTQGDLYDRYHTIHLKSIFKRTEHTMHGLIHADDDDY